MSVLALVLLVGLVGGAVLLVPPRRPGPVAVRRRVADGGSGDRARSTTSRGALSRRWRPTRGGEDPSGWVAELAEVVAVGLRAGLDLSRAVRVAARSPAVARSVPWLAAAVDRSPDVAATVAGLARSQSVDARAGHDLVVLARAWHLSSTTGAAVAATTAAAAGAVRSRRAARQRTDAVLAGPRASMRLLTLLPLGGPFVGLLVGLDPAEMYSAPAARVGALAGLVLTAGGWAWAALLLRRAARPGTTRGPS